MSKIAQQTTSTGTNLVLGQMLYTIIIGIGSIIIARVLGLEQYGFYSMILGPLALLQLVRDWGVPYSVQQRISEGRGKVTG